MKTLLSTLLIGGFAATTANAAIISQDGSLYTSITGSPGFNANLEVSNLFNQNYTVGFNPGVGDAGGAWAAANGTAPDGPRLEFELDQVYIITDLVYGQRQFASQDRDKNQTARIWASSTTAFTLATPAGAPDATVNLNFTTAGPAFTNYALSSAITGRYFYIEFDEAPNGGNNDPTGGNELRFQGDAVPEPSSAALLGLGGLALIMRRRK
ncbi:hypothetical protein NT6N_21460 [Oceaniferula spumae]|uniref:Ice-binding protein C-terminal domain-containing protein n=1 Tax=Oceaniferula spumae TaxID=2979115 RepID=A0AAT9FM68_9BACT